MTLEFARIFPEDGFANALYFEQLIGLSPGKLCDGANVSCSKPCFVSDSTHTGASLVLNLRDYRASKPPSILKPFFRGFPRAGQPSSPHQSRESQVSVKQDRPYPSFSSSLTPYKGLQHVLEPVGFDGEFRVVVYSSCFFDHGPMLLVPAFVSCMILRFGRRREPGEKSF